MKNKTGLNHVHTPKSPRAVTDHYGSGIKNAVGKPLRSYLDPIESAKKIGKPPKSLA